jgi:hypothetical protein
MAGLQVLEHHINVLQKNITETSPVTIKLLQLIPTQQKEQEREELPNTINGIVQLLVDCNAVPKTYCFNTVTTAPLTGIHKIISVCFSALQKLDETEKKAKTAWVKVQTTTLIPYVENAFTKHLHSTTVANKQKTLADACRAVDTVTRKYLIPPPNPYDSLPTTSPRPILKLRQYRIPNEAREILEDYYIRYQGKDGKSFLPPALYPLVEQLTGLPKKTILISTPFLPLTSFTFDIPYNYFQNSRNRKPKMITDSSLADKLEEDIRMMKELELHTKQRILEEAIRYPFPPSSTSRSLSHSLSLPLPL